MPIQGNQTLKCSHCAMESNVLSYKYYLTKENNQTNKINIIIQINYNKYIIQIIFLVLWIPLLTPLSLKIFFRSKIPLYKLYNTTLFDLSFAKDPKYNKSNFLFICTWLKVSGKVFERGGGRVEHWCKSQKTRWKVKF